MITKKKNDLTGEKVCFSVLERSIPTWRENAAAPNACQRDGRHVHIQGVDERVDLKNYGSKEPPGLKGNEK